MTKSILSAAILLLSFTASAQNKLLHSPAHIGFVYPLSTHGTYARDYSNAFSIHALVGVSGAEEAFCASGISNIIYNNAKGFTVAGFSNHIGGNTKGLVSAGFVNTLKGDAKGLQAAGFTNVTKGFSRGMQAAGFVNVSKSVRGTQLAGFANVAVGNINGFQGAGYVNVATRNVKGVQAAGFVNTARNVNGVQIAGYVNKAKNVNTQISGFLNIADTVKGVQISGFINIADSCDYPIGVINIIKKGEKALGFSTDENLTTMVNFRSGGRVLYGIIGMGYSFKPAFNTLLVAETGMGAHIRIGQNVRLNLEATTTSYTDFTDVIMLRSSLRVLPALNFGKVEIFAGPTINEIQSNDLSGSPISRNYLWSNNNWGSFNGIYIGAYGGIQYKF